MKTTSFARRMRHTVRRGLSLVELMIGVTIGLFVVAAATVMVSGQLGENRRLLIETQLQQDMRATSDVVTRELRRIGAVQFPHNSVAYALAPAEEQPLYATTPASGPSNPADFTFKYDREGGDAGFLWGFRLQGDVIQSRSRAGWQDLTDPSVMLVETFSIQIERATAQQVPCPNLCAGGDTSCWPLVHVRDFVVQIVARARSDATVRRSITSRVRARNDWVEFRVPSGASNTACPS